MHHIHDNDNNLSRSISISVHMSCYDFWLKPYTVYLELEARQMLHGSDHLACLFSPLRGDHLRSSADMAARKRSTFVNGKSVLQTEHLSFDFTLDLMWNFHVMQHWVPSVIVSPNCELPRHLFAQMPVRQFDDTKWWIRVPQRVESQVFRSHSSILSR